MSDEEGGRLEAGCRMRDWVNVSVRFRVLVAAGTGGSRSWGAGGV
jgi:hypothetical protein